MGKTGLPVYRKPGLDFLNIIDIKFSPCFSFTIYDYILEPIRHTTFFTFHILYNKHTDFITIIPRILNFTTLRKNFTMKKNIKLLSK